MKHLKQHYDANFQVLYLQFYFGCLSKTDLHTLIFEKHFSQMLHCCNISGHAEQSSVI